MLEVALNFLEKIEEHGYQAYIVGGFVRDYLLGIESNDIDIATNARPSDIKLIFKDNCMPNDDYGSVVVMVKNTRFEVTTFRKEISYVDNRKPLEYVYIDDLKEDLLRRDFTINAICMDKDKNIIDLLNGRDDLDKMEINTIGNSIDKFTEDALRILRAVRFATVLDFKLSDEVKEGIISTRHLLSNLSYERKKEELDKIFSSIHVKYGVKLLIELGLDIELELSNLKNINCFDSLIGIWTLLDVESIYPFTKNEKDIISDIKEAMKEDILNPMTLYKYGLYISSIVGDIKGLDRKKITFEYENLPIKERNEIDISGDEIIAILNKEPGAYLKEIYSDLEESIIRGNLVNDNKIIKEYIVNKYINTQI